MVYPYSQYGYPTAAANAWIAEASNVKLTTNPPYTAEMFQEDFNQFTGLLPPSILTQFIAMATNTVLQARWHDSWRYGMGLFIAHFATLYLQTMGGTESPNASQVISAAQARGLQTSKSVGDVSVSYDFSSIAKDLEGWASFTTTQFGQQYATLASMMGKAGMYVW